jgi:hypothetical protein
VNLFDLLGLAFVGIFLGLMLASAFYWRKHPTWSGREIPAFGRLRRAIGLAVEAGNRLHISLGRGDLISTHSAVGFVGLSILDRISRSTAASDRPPVATSGESMLAVLSQDTLHGASKFMGADYDPLRGQLTGLTPYAYAAGTAALIHDEEMGANLLIGSFGSEVALITEASDRSEGLTLAGTDNLTGQAVLYATAQEPLIGEDTYAGGAYMGAGGMHQASLTAQDVLRWIIILALLVGAVLKLAGVL